MAKRWFYIQQGDSFVGMALLSALDSGKECLLKFLIVIPEAPRGTSEFLMTAILKKLRRGL